MTDSLHRPPKRAADEQMYNPVVSRPTGAIGTDDASDAPTSPPVDDPQPSRMRRWIVGSLAVSIISIATLLMLEGAASAVLFVRDYQTAIGPTTQIRPHTEHDTLLGWINRASFSDPNEYGRGIAFNTTPERFRGRGALAALPAGHTRLVCSGDSFTMGSGVADEDTWCAALHRLVPSLETVNMGQGAYGLDQAYLWYRRDAARVPHQVQVLALNYVQFERALVPTFAGRFKPHFTLEGDRLVLRNVPVPVQTMSALRREYASSRLIEQLRLVQAVRRISGFDGRKGPGERVLARWPLFEAIFDELAAFDRANGTQLVIAYLPTRRDAKPGDLDGRRRRLAAYSVRRDVPFIDLTAALRALPDDSLNLMFITHIEDGVAAGVLGHYTAAGGTWAARELAKGFAGNPRLRGFIPTPPLMAASTDP
jgi:hypothetical protein